MKRIWTIIGVADVARSFAWYQSLFGQVPTSRRILLTGARELALRDPDGYYVMVSALPSDRPV